MIPARLIHPGARRRCRCAHLRHVLRVLELLPPWIRILSYRSIMISALPPWIRILSYRSIMISAHRHQVLQDLLLWIKNCHLVYGVRMTSNAGAHPPSQINESPVCHVDVSLDSVSPLLYVFTLFKANAHHHHRWMRLQHASLVLPPWIKMFPQLGASLQPLC